MRHFAIFVFFSLINTAFAQVLSVTPAFPSQNDTVTIVYDASQGNGALTGIVPVYAHAGLITNQSTSATDWKHVQGNWGTADPKVLMTALGNNKHQIKYHIPTYYGIGAGVSVQQLAFVFRDASGSNVGRAASGADIYYDVYPANTGLLAKFMSPTSTPLIHVGDSIEVVVAATQKADVTVYDNGTQVYNDSTKQTSFYVTATTPGLHEVYVAAELGTQTSNDTIYYAVNPPLEVAVLPTGFKMGLNEVNDTTVFFQLYAPSKSRVYVLTSLNDYMPDTLNAMVRNPGGQWWFKEMTVPGTFQ